MFPVCVPARVPARVNDMLPDRILFCISTLNDVVWIEDRFTCSRTCSRHSFPTCVPARVPDTSSRYVPVFYCLYGCAVELMHVCTETHSILSSSVVFLYRLKWLLII